MKTKPIKILLIEDNPSDVIVIKHKLDKAYADEIQLSCHQTLATGLVAYEKDGADLIILDLFLPDTDGIQTLLRARRVATNVPIIILTGSDDDELGVEALRHGAQDYLVKSKINADTLHRSLRYSLERSRAQAALLQSEEHFRLAFQEAPIGVVITENWVIVRANRAFHEMSGLNFKECIGANLLDIVLSTDEHDNGNGTASHRVPVFEKIEYRFIKRTDETIWVRASAQKMKSSDGSDNAVVIIENFTEEKQAEATRAFLASIVESSSDAIIGNSLDGTIISCNKSTSRIYGFAPAEIIGRSEKVFIPPENREEFAIMMDSVRKGEILQYETQRLTKDAKKIDISLTVSPIVDASGNITGSSTIARDITEQKRNERNAQNVMLMRERDHFMAALTHDLQNPLVGANRVLEKFLEGKLGHLTAEQSMLLREILDSNNSLLGLVQNLLDVYRREKNVDSIRLAICKVDSILQEVIKVIYSIAESRQIHVSSDIQPDISTFADALALRRVFQNIFDNALKFTPQSGQIKAKLSADDKTIKVEIANDGESIPQEDLENMFNRFWRAPKTKRYTPGVGLGLYVCKQILQSHAGTIKCQTSTEGLTVFTITLPRYSSNPVRANLS